MIHEADKFYSVFPGPSMLLGLQLTLYFIMASKPGKKASAFVSLFNRLNFGINVKGFCFFFQNTVFQHSLGLISISSDDILLQIP